MCLVQNIERERKREIKTRWRARFGAGEGGAEQVRQLKVPLLCNVQQRWSTRPGLFLFNQTWGLIVMCRREHAHVGGGGKGGARGSLQPKVAPRSRGKKKKDPSMSEEAWWGFCLLIG